MAFEINRGALNGIKRRWVPVKLKSHRRTAMITCPGCGRIGSLDAFQIGSDGVVHPVFGCAHRGCEFKDQVKLVGWGRYIDEQARPVIGEGHPNEPLKSTGGPGTPS